MARIVQKFGGTSVADVKHIGIAALRVKAEVERGNDVAVVVSAMSGVHKSVDRLCSTGEPVTRHARIRRCVVRWRANHECADGARPQRVGGSGQILVGLAASYLHRWRAWQCNDQSDCD